MSAAKTEFSESVAPSPESAAPAWQIELLYDGECPLCVREVNFLKKRDAGRGLVSFVDIADDGYNPEPTAESTTKRRWVGFTRYYPTVRRLKM